MKPAPLHMWAVIVRSKCSVWIFWPSIHRTRKGAWGLYLEGYLPDYRAEAERERRKKKVRLARVVVTEMEAGK